MHISISIYTKVYGYKYYVKYYRYEVGIYIGRALWYCILVLHNGTGVVDLY